MVFVGAKGSLFTASTLLSVLINSGNSFPLSGPFNTKPLSTIFIPLSSRVVGKLVVFVTEFSIVVVRCFVVVSCVGVVVGNFVVLVSGSSRAT